MSVQPPNHPGNVTILRTTPIYGISMAKPSALPLTGVAHEPHTIEWLWRLLNTLPKSRPQLRNSQNATARLLKWRSKSVLPPRRAYLSTVDYYEACEPLYVARARFLSFASPSLMRGVMCACRKILPKILF